MERLMSVSSDYWSTFINIDADGTRDLGTPRLSEGITDGCEQCCDINIEVYL